MSTPWTVGVSLYLLVAFVAAGRFISWSAWRMADYWEQKKPDFGDWWLSTMGGMAASLVWPAIGLGWLVYRLARTDPVRATVRLWLGPQRKRT